jgi:hypothetical protein
MTAVITRPRRPRAWTRHLRHALASPGNLITGAGAALVSAATWNPLPLILYGLGQPVWLYTAATSRRYARQLRDDHHDAASADRQRALTWRAYQLGFLLETTPCRRWVRRGRLDDYAAIYGRLLELRDQAGWLVCRRYEAGNALEQDLVARMDDLLRAYLGMAQERLLFYCALAKLYPRLPEPPAPAASRSLFDRIKAVLLEPRAAEPADLVPWAEDTPFVSLDDARAEIRGKLAGFQRDLARDPAQDEAYRPSIEVLERRLDELDRRGRHDLALAAQLQVFPDQFEIILGKLAATESDVDEVITDMKLLIEQTDDTVRFAEDIRTTERRIPN